MAPYAAIPVMNPAYAYPAMPQYTHKVARDALHLTTVGTSTEQPQGNASSH
jgi:hypothetical protein